MMAKRLLNTWTIVLGSALLVGAICNNFFLSMGLAAGMAVALPLTAVGFVIDLIFKSSKGIQVTGFLFLFFLTATISSFVSTGLSRDWAQSKGSKVVNAIYDYKTKQGRFPTNIASLPIDDQLKKKYRQGYSTDSTFNEFRLIVHSDGWHWTEFRSIDSTWVTDD